MLQELGFDKVNEKVINPLDFKDGIIKYIKRANCAICFTDKTLSCSESIEAINNGTPEGIAICNRVIEDALQVINSR